MTLTAWMTVAGLILVGSTGSGGVVYWLLNRKSQEKIDNKIDTERENLAAEAATKWQQLWDENAQGAYKALDQRCNKCVRDLGEVCEVFGGVLGKIAQHLDEPGAVDLNAVLVVAQRQLAKYTP